MFRLFLTPMLSCILISMSVEADSRFASSPGQEGQVAGSQSVSVYHQLETSERVEIENEIEALENRIELLRQRTFELDNEIADLEMSRQGLMLEYNQFMSDFGY